MEDKRILELLGKVDALARECHMTTAEMLVVARQMAVSATAQMAEDNPGCDRFKLVCGVVTQLEDALKQRVLKPMMPGGMAN